MKFLFQQTYFITFLLVVILTNTANSQIQIMANKVGRGGIALPGYTVPDALFAMNTEDIFKRFDTGNSAFYNKLNDMSIKRLYYPGGSSSRLFHHYTGFSGNGNTYGYQANPWEDLIDGKGKEYDIMSTSTYGYFISDFVSLCNTSSADVVLSYNILYGNICELKDLLDYFKANLNSTRTVDILILNTEVHNKDDRDLIPNISTYYEKIKPFLDYLKIQTIYTGVKVSLDIAPDNVYATAASDNVIFDDDWNDGINQIINSAAYSPMNLSGTINWWWYPADPLYNYPGCGPDCNDQCYPTQPTTSTNWTTYFGHGLADALDFNNNSVPAIADYYKGKGIEEMNISQWGVKEFQGANGNSCLLGNDPQYADAKYYNSMLQAMFMTKFLMNLIDYNFANGEFFKSANYFDLASNNLDRDPLYTTVVGDPGNISISTSVSYLLYKDILSKSRGLYWQTSQNPNLTVDPNVEQFYFESGGNSYFVLINENPSSVYLNTKAVVNTSMISLLKAYQSIKTLSSTNGSLWGSVQTGVLSHPALITGGASIPPIATPSFNGQYYIIPGNSITIIQLVP